MAFVRRTGHIVCTYTCGKCGLSDVKVNIPARLDPDAMSVTDWMKEVVTVYLCNDHAIRSPLCRPKQLDLVKIPSPPDQEGVANWIGKECDIIPPGGPGPKSK